jgi:hypothetical protein
MQTTKPMLALTPSTINPALWRRVFSFPALLGVLLAAGAYVATSLNGVPGGKIFAEGNTWMHTLFGEHLLRTHTWPEADIYSFTASGVPRIDYEWMGEVTMALARRLGGLQGLAALLIFWSVLFTLLLFCFAYLRSGDTKASAAASATLLAVVGSFFTLRPQLLGYCFLLLTLIGLELARKGRTWVLGIFPLLFLLWVNTHSSFILGLAVMGIYFLEGLFEFRSSWVRAERWSPAFQRKFALSGLGSVFALFITPYGGRLAAYPMEVMQRQRLVLASNTEWLPVWQFHSTRDVAALVLLLLFFAGIYLLRPVAIPLRDGIFLAGTVVGACLHVRMLVVFAMAAAPIAATLLSRVMSPYDPGKDKPTLNGLLIVGTIVACVAAFPSRCDLERSLALEFPVGNLAYLRAHPESLPVFNRAEWGAYMAYYGVNAFIYGQLDLFEYTGVLSDYLRILHPMSDQPGQVGAESLLKKYSIRSCLIEPHSPLAEFLERRPGWRVVSSDQVSVLIEYAGSPPTKGDRP